jgi:DNA-directed RNA polymerase subunit RPC12/RpoP
MTITVKDYRCESCGSEYGLRWDEEESEYKPEFCPFCSEEVQNGDDEWDDVGMFYVDEDELEQ